MTFELVPPLIHILIAELGTDQQIDSSHPVIRQKEMCIVHLYS